MLTHSTSLVRPSPPRESGMTLIELMLSLSIVAISLGLAAPSFSLWMKNARIRTTAEAVQNSLQFSRTEAVRRNQVVRFQLVDTLDDGCALSDSGTYSITNMGSSTTPAGACGNAINDSTSPNLLQKSTLFNVNNIKLSASQAVFAFNGFGGQAATTNPSVTPPSGMSIELTAAQGTCIKDGGDVRCLNVIVSPAGQIRMCDPNKTASTDADKC